jgi:hypothetical protein
VDIMLELKEHKIKKRIKRTNIIEETIIKYLIEA